MVRVQIKESQKYRCVTPSNSEIYTAVYMEKRKALSTQLLITLGCVVVDYMSCDLEAIEARCHQ